MSTKNIVFNIRTDEDTVNKFKSLSDKPNTTQGEFLKKLVEEYEKNLGFKEDIEFTLLSRTLEDVKETQVFKFKGRIIFTTAFRKPPLGLYIKNLREISKYIKKEHNIFENLNDVDLYMEKDHKYLENIILYETTGNNYIVFYQKDLNSGLYSYLDYKVWKFKDKKEVIKCIHQLINNYEMNSLLVATTDIRDVMIIE